MKLVPSLVCIAACIALALASGCADTSFGTLKPTDFGTSAEEAKVLDYYKQKYGEPGQPGEPRFLEPTLTTGLDPRNLPVDSITTLGSDTPKVYFWVFYDRFAKGDPMTITWTYLDNNKVVLTETEAAGGVYGRVFAGFEKPDRGWPAGKHQVTISGKGATASKTFEVTSGKVTTSALPFAPNALTVDGEKQDKDHKGWATVRKGSGSSPVQGSAPPPVSCMCAAGRACGDWDGTWHHADENLLDGTMAICQDSSSLTATYTLAQAPGRITATVSGNRATGTWTEYESDGVTVAGTGRVIMLLNPGNNGWQAWYSFSGALPDTSGPAPWTGTRTGSCPECGAGSPRTLQTREQPPLATAQPTTPLPFATARTTTPLPWQTAVTTTSAGSTCGGHCDDQDRQCGLWDARWHHRNWGDNLEGTMTLCQNGNTVTGTYTIAQTPGRISGTTSGVSGTELRGTWTEYEADGSTVQGTGAFVYRLKAGNTAWDGWFNYQPGGSVDTSGAATWTGTRL